MTEAEYYKEFIDWLESTGRITVKDMDKFQEWQKKQKRYKEAKDFVDENFKGMF